MTPPTVDTERHTVALWPYVSGMGPYLSSTGMVAAATAVSYLIQATVLPSTLSLVFLTAVLASALRYGLWPSVMASGLSLLSWNFFFLPPKFSLAIGSSEDLLALVLFLVVALVVSNLAALQQRQSEAIGARAKATARLYIFSEKIAGATTLDDLLSVVARTIGAMLNCEVVLLLPRGNTLEITAGYPRAEPVSEIEMDRARRIWRAGSGSDENAGGDYLLLPLRTGGETVGVAGVRRAPPISAIPEDRRLLAILVDQAAVAISRIELAQSIGRARLEAETERLRSAMLTSLSHDLRTPLTTIIAAHSTLRSLDEACDPATRRELLERAQDEAERLNRFIGNLLDMTRLEFGSLRVRLEPIDLAEAIESAVNRAAPMTAAHQMSVALPADLPMVDGDFLLLEQAFFNVIDNAARYSPPGGRIAISAREDDRAVIVEIADEGAGIPPDALEIIFDKFARVAEEDRRRPGTGLGLAICRGFLDATGGTIAAANRTDRSGAVFTIRLPRAGPLELPL